jgi:peptidoglycan/xylan/chitin deacetylase (PgdA/CDA1 family)
MILDRPAPFPLRGHDRFAYRGINDRPVFDWLEHFAFGEGLGAELAPAGGQPDVLNFAWREYGNRVGVWRLLDLFGELAMPASAIVNSTIQDHCPEVMGAVRARGDEVVGHGRTNSERQGSLDEAGERAWISESAVTPDLLQEAGYRYVLDWCMDDQPVMLKTRGGGLLAVPYPQEMNDIPAIVARKDSASQFADMIIDNFDEMLAQAEAGPLVMGIALHPYIVGQPYRLRHLRRALAHIAARREEIWITRAGDIAAYCLADPGRYV